MIFAIRRLPKLDPLPVVVGAFGALEFKRGLA